MTDEHLTIREFQMFLDQHMRQHEERDQRVDKHIDIIHNRIWKILYALLGTAFLIIAYLLTQGVPWHG